MNSIHDLRSLRRRPPSAHPHAALLALLLLLGMALLVSAWGGTHNSLANSPAPPTVATEGWANLPLLAQGAIAAAVGRSEPTFHATASGSGYRLANAAHDFQITTTHDGFVIRAGAAQWQLSLTAWGYGQQLQPVLPAAPQGEGNRVTYQRGTLSEWYANGPLGLQQGFTLTERPPVGFSDGPLTLALQMSGDLHPTLDDERTGLALATDDGTTQLHYRGLIAYDATERQLPPGWRCRMSNYWCAWMIRMPSIPSCSTPSSSVLNSCAPTPLNSRTASEA